jgi:hypothetical protein
MDNRLEEGGDKDRHRERQIDKERERGVKLFNRKILTLNYRM